MRLKMGSRTLGVFSLIVVIFVISEFAVTVNSFSFPFRTPSRRTNGGPQSQRHRPPNHFLRRMGPRPLGNPEPKSIEDGEDSEEENESQARVEPQVTPLNRDQCLAKLLCGMSVPVTGGGAPKNGYYSEYANVVGKFFEAFPLEEEEKSAESTEAYDDYSVEHDEAKAGPSRMNSKLKNVDDNKSFNSATPAAGGLRLFDLANIKEASTNSSDKTDDDERNARQIQSNIGLRVARARRMVAKLGEKLNTVRQCQQILGCPFTFKQLRSKLKTGPSSVTSNVPLTTDSASSTSQGKPIPNANTDPVFPPVNPVKYTYNTNNYRPLQKARPKKRPGASTELSLGSPVNLGGGGDKGSDDELEEFYDPPPIFGSNGRPTTKDKLKPLSQIEKLQSVDVEYVPYNPPVRRGAGSKAKVTSGSPFPKRRVVGYKLPSFGKRPSGENDEFDDVNLSTGPIALVGGDDGQKKQQQQQPLFAIEGQYDKDQEILLRPVSADGGDGQESEKEAEDDTKNSNNDDDGSDEGEEDDEDGDGDDDEEEDEEDEGDDEEADYEEDEEEDEVEEKVTKKKKNKKTATTKTEETPTKKKITKYKNPNPETLLNVFVEEEFPVKKNPEDDEQDHPDNAWTKLAFATSSALIKEPENRKKTYLEEKNDQKLNLSKEKKTDEEEEDDKVDEENSDEEHDEEEEAEEEEDDDDAQSRSQVKANKKNKDATITTSKKSESKSKIESQDDEVDDFKSRNKNRPRSAIKKQKKHGSKLSVEDEEEFDRISESLSKPGTVKTKNKHNSNNNKSRSGTKSSAKDDKEDKSKKDKTKKRKPSSKDDSEEEDDERNKFLENLLKKKPTPAPLLQIGGRPIVPPPETDTKQASKTGALSRFNFNLVRPFGAQMKEEVQAQSYHQVVKQAPVYEPSLPNYSSSSSGTSHLKSSLPKPSNSFRRESLFGSSSSSSSGSSKIKGEGGHTSSSLASYIPSTSFGSSNKQGNVGNVEFLTNPSSGSGSSSPSHYTFPFGSPLSTLKNLFNRPSSSSQDIPGSGGQPAPISAFLHRPTGPASNNYKRTPQPSSRSDEIDDEVEIGGFKKGGGRGRSGIKKKKKKSTKKNSKNDHSSPSS